VCVCVCVCVHVSVSLCVLLSSLLHLASVHFSLLFLPRPDQKDQKEP